VPKSKRFHSSVGCVLASSAIFVGVAAAQEARPSQEMDEVVVTGICASIRSALEIKRDAVQGTSDVWLLARIYTLVGEPEKALDNLEQLLKVPSYLSPGWLRIDPNFDPLRKNPRFQKLVAGGK